MRQRRVATVTVTRVSHPAGLRRDVTERSARPGGAGRCRERGRRAGGSTSTGTGTRGTARHRAPAQGTAPHTGRYRDSGQGLTHRAVPAPGTGDFPARHGPAALFDPPTSGPSPHRAR